MAKIVPIILESSTVFDRFQDSTFSMDDLSQLYADTAYDTFLATCGTMVSEGVESFDDIDQYLLNNRESVRFLKTNKGVFGIYEDSNKKVRLTFTTVKGSFFTLCEQVSLDEAFSAYNSYFSLISEKVASSEDSEKVEQKVERDLKTKEDKASAGVDPTEKTTKVDKEEDKDPTKPSETPSTLDTVGADSFPNFVTALKPGEKGKSSLDDKTESSDDPVITIKKPTGNPIKKYGSMEEYLHKFMGAK